MDALALLCNLYGDGPATLKRLKAAGLSSVESLHEIEAADLADTLETTEAAARRFLREARLLGERMAESRFEEEASPPIAHQGACPVPIIELEPDAAAEAPATADAMHVEPAREEPVEVSFEDEGLEVEDDSVVAEEDAEESLVGEVLTTWRERDILVEGDWDETEIQQETRVPDDLGIPLELRLLDGLSAEWCQRFAEVEIRTLEDLAEMDTLRVAEQLGEALTRLDRFRFLARRELEAAPAEARSLETQPLETQPLEEATAGILVPQPASSVRAAPPASIVPAAPGGPAAQAARATGATGPWPAAPAEAVKFSLSGTPFSGTQGPLARELDRAAEPQVEDLAADAGSAGPFV